MSSDTTTSRIRIHQFLSLFLQQFATYNIEFNTNIKEAHFISNVPIQCFPIRLFVYFRNLRKIILSLILQLNIFVANFNF